MSANTFFVLYLIVGVVCGAFSSIVASAKNQGGVHWFFLGLIFSIFALIAIAGMPVDNPKAQKAGEDYKNWKCPKCGTIQPGWSQECKCGYVRAETTEAKNK